MERQAEQAEGAIGRRGQRFTAVNTPLRDIIRFAYKLEPFQTIEGDRRWLDDRFDIAAIIPDSQSTGDESAMLRALLAERFKLSVRWATRERSVYALVLARRDERLGPGMKPSTVDCNVERATPRQLIEARRDQPISAGDYASLTRPVCDMIFQPFRARIHAGARTMGDLARVLSRLPMLGSPVVDRTGLTGAFDFELAFVPERAAGAANVSATGSNDPTLFVALQEQLGLKLESSRGSVEVLVIEGVERPTPD